ncbi:MAG TPA: ABC transporter permease, partial [Erysipelotrichaceae bacterium]|nr:ABC transporter permease [Erysipelotrichaceae bacterium]
GTSAMLLMSGIILLCTSFLIIRFTILFQIESNYAEIGIMKAIGFQHSQIKPLYLMKYMSITLIGVIIGFFASIPFAELLESMQ